MEKSRASLFKFIMLSFFTWSSVPLLYALIPVYLQNIGFDDFKIGLLTASGPICCIAVQPFVGAMADRAQYKNNILMLIYIGVTGSTLLMALDSSFYYLLAIGMVLAVFQSGMLSLSETITLEYLDGTGWNYGPVRVFGSIGYSVIAVLIGSLTRRQPGALFFITALASFFCSLIMIRAPRIRGHQSGGNRVPFVKLFDNPRLIIYVFFHMVIQISFSFFSSFFPVFLSEIGGSERLFGLVLFIQTMGEVPFLFFGDRIISRIGTAKMLMGSMLITAVRFLLLVFVRDPLLTIPISLLHVGTYAVFTFCLSVFINREVPKELKATGQAFNNVMGMGVGRMLGSILGGLVCQIFGTRRAFLYAFALDLAAFIAFGCIMHKLDKNSQKKEPDKLQKTTAC